MSYRHFENKECEYWPCKECLTLNCLFCYCPLYQYGDCGGDYSRTGNGIKDCSKCKLPHQEGGDDYVNAFLEERKFERSID